MINKRIVLLLLVLVSNVAIVAGAVAFEWNSLTVVALFVVDGLLGFVRMSLERAFARRPVADKYYPPTTPYTPNEWYRIIMDKVGSIQISDRLPCLTVRYLQYTIAIWNMIFVVGIILGLGWYTVEPTSSVAPTLVAILPLLVAKHASIVAVWAEKGVYEHASPATVRHRSVLYSGALIVIAIFVIAPQPLNLVVGTTVIMIGPKLLIDFREAGIGPWPLTFDPTSDTKRNHFSAPTGMPRYVFQTDHRALLSWACLEIGIPYILHPGMFVFLLTAVLIWPFVSFLTTILSFGELATFSGTLVFALPPTVGLVLGVSYFLTWLGHANVEYRIYDDDLVAYDRYLEEPQWVVPVDDIESVSTNRKTLLLARVIPSATSEFTTVYLECATGEDRELEFLERPDEFVRIVRGKVRGQSAV